VFLGSVVPMVIEHDGRRTLVRHYSRAALERNRVPGPRGVDDQIANLVAAQLLHLDAQDPGRDILSLLNSPGGSRVLVDWRSTTANAVRAVGCLDGFVSGWMSFWER